MSTPDPDEIPKMWNVSKQLSKYKSKVYYHYFWKQNKNEKEIWSTNSGYCNKTTVAFLLA